MKKGVTQQANILESAKYDAEEDPVFMEQIKKFGFSDQRPSEDATKQEDLKYNGFRAYKELIETEIGFIRGLGFFGKQERDILQKAFKEAKNKKLPESARWEDLKPLLDKMEELRQGHLDFLKVLRESPPSAWAAKLEEIQKIEAEYGILQSFFQKKTLPEEVKFALSVAEVAARKKDPKLPTRFGFDDLSSFLIRPVQRLAKYPLLMKELSKSSTFFSENEQQFKNFAKYVNNAVDKAEKAKLIAADFSEIVMRENTKNLPSKQAAKDKVLGIRAVFAETAHHLELQTKSAELSKENPFVLAFKEAYRKALEGRVLGKEALDPKYQSSFDFAIKSLSRKNLSQLGTSTRELTLAKKAVLEEFKQNARQQTINPTIATPTPHPPQQWVKSNAPAEKRKEPFIFSSQARDPVTKPSVQQVEEKRKSIVQTRINQFEDIAGGTSPSPPKKRP